MNATPAFARARVTIRVAWPILRWGVLHARPRVIRSAFEIALSVWRGL